MILYHRTVKGQYEDGFKYTIHHFLAIERLGISFSYKGDEVIWVWPWGRKKNNGAPYTVRSLGFEAYYYLWEIDYFWKEYMEALNAEAEENGNDFRARTSSSTD